MVRRFRVRVRTAIRCPAATRRKNTAHAARRGWGLVQEEAPKGRKNGYDTIPSRRHKLTLFSLAISTVCYRRL